MFKYGIRDQISFKGCFVSGNIHVRPKKISSFVCDKSHSGQANFILESLEGCMEVECNILRKGKIPI